MTVYALASALGAPLLLAWAGRFDARTVLLWAMAGLAAANVASALATDWGGLAAARVAMALAAGLFTPTASALAVALVPASMRARALSIAFSGVGLSYVVGVPFGAWAGVSRFGWPLAFWVVAAVAAAAGLALRRVPRGVPTAPASLAAYGRLLRTPRTLGALAVTAAYFASIFCIFSFIGAFLTAHGGVSPGAVAPVLAAFGLAALAGTFAGGRLADRFGPTRVLYAICAGFALVFALLWATPGRPAVQVGAFLVWGVIGFAFYAAQQSRLIALAPGAATAAIALNASMLYLGTAAGAAIGGAMVAAFGWSSLPPAGAALIGVVALLVRATEPGLRAGCPPTPR
jgi:DHA1 family inner membrane transport protein